MSTLLASVVLVAPDAAMAAQDATLAAGFYETGGDRIVLNGWSFMRFGTYGVTIDGTPQRAVSIAVEQNVPGRHKSPSATDLVELSNIYSSPLLDYLLWKYGTTDDPVRAAALHIIAWHLTGRPVGSPTIGASGPTTPGWGPPDGMNPGIIFQHPPRDITGAPAPADQHALGDLIEAEAKALVAGQNHLLGPWTLDMSLNWGSKQGTVSVRSAADVGVSGVTVALQSTSAVVPASVVTNGDGEATFAFTPLGTDVTVESAVHAPGVHTEHDVLGDPVHSGYQRVAVGHEEVLADSFTIREPQITTFAKDAVDGDKVVGAGGSIVDTIQYQNLVPGATYTARVIWYYQDTAESSPLSATATFVAGPTGSGSVDVGPTVTGITELGRSLVAYQFLYAGPTSAGFPELIHANINDFNQTVAVQSLQLITAARDTYDGDGTAYAGASVMDTVAYLGLAPGTKFTARVEWHYTDGTNDLGSTGLTATKTFFADASGFGTVDVGPVTLTGAEVGLNVVAFERIFIGESTSGIPIGTHEAPDDPNQTIMVLPPNVLTVAQDVADGDKVVDAIGQIIDQIVYANLHPGVTYTARLEWRLTNGAVDLGPTGLFATKTFTPTATTGSVIVGPVRVPGTLSGVELVAYERIYLGSTATGAPVSIHEAPADPAQRIIVREQTISTEATQGTAGGVAIPGDKFVPIGANATIVDTVVLNAVAGASVVLTGYLVRYHDGECSDPISTVSSSALIPANHTLTVVHPVPEAPGEYVAYVVVRTPGGSHVSDHQDCLAESQRVMVTGDDLPETR